ncbi:MAG: WD40/YVTN/BNR-like repeat-containing protein [Halobacteriota archaeon]
MTTVYAALRDALVVTTGGPDDWTTTERLADHDLECVAVSPDAPERVLCGTFEAGLFRSEDGGGTFGRIGAEALPDSVMSVGVNPHDPDEVWVGTEPSRVYHSVDGGDSWTEKSGLADLDSATGWYFPPRPTTHHVRWIEVDPADTDHLYVGIEAGALVQTHDGGQTWEDRQPTTRLDNHSLTTHPDAPEWAWAAAGDGYAETRDGGNSWSHPQDNLDHRYCWSVAVDAEDPETVLLSAASGPRSAHTPSAAESYVYRRRRGLGWERLDDRGIPTGEGTLRAVLARSATGGTFYAANNHGVFVTTDAGDSWTELDIEWPERYETQTVRGVAVIEAD